MSPDGQTEIAYVGDTVTIKGQGNDRSIRLARQEDRLAFEGFDEYEPTWLGSDHLLVESDEALVLELSSAKLHRLFHRPKLSVQSASRDGRIIIVQDQDGNLLWARRRGSRE